MGDKYKKNKNKNLKYKKPHRDKEQRLEMDVFDNYIGYMAWGNKEYLRKILNIEHEFNMANSSSNPVHTLPYYIANTIKRGLETKSLNLLVDLMQKKDSTIFCDEKTAQRIIREVASGDGYHAMKRFIEENEGNFYITGNLAHKLEEEPYLIIIKNANTNINILDLLGTKNKANIQTRKNKLEIQTRKIDTKRLADKKEAYIRIRELLYEYFDIIKYKAPNDGKRLIDCICDILNLLRVFPEYFNESILIKLFENIPISDEEYKQYLALLNDYNSINEQIKNGTATKYDMVNSIFLSSQMAKMIYPTMKDETITGFFKNIFPFFKKDIELNELSEDEEKKWRNILSSQCKDNFLLNQGKNPFEIDIYSTPKKDHSIGLIGDKLYVLLRKRKGVCSTELSGIEIHTINEVYTIDIADDDNALKYKWEFDFNKMGGPRTLEVYMPLKGSRESASLKTPDGKEEGFTMLDDGRCLVFKKTRNSETMFEYNSYEDFLTRNPSKSETIRNENQGVLEKIFPAKPIDQELNKITEFAIAHNIKGVIPKDILELYRSEIPIFATLIDNYGLRIPDEREMFRIPYSEEIDVQSNAKAETPKKDIADEDDNIDY